MRCYLRVKALATGAVLAILAGCAAPRQTANGVLGWVPWGRSHPAVKAAPAAQNTLRTRNLAITLRLEPFPVRLSETRRVAAVILLKNVSAHYVQLEFPTTQRFEVSLREEKGGRILAQWSEDQAFESVPGYLGINPGEQVEYRAELSTRDLEASGRYTLSVSIPSRNDLTTQVAFVPQK